MTVSQPKTCFLFDLDGTLVDSSPGYIVAFNALLAKHDQYPADDDSIRETISAGARTTIKQLWQTEVTADQIEEIRHNFIEIYHSRAALCQRPEVVAYPGIPEMLAKLKAQGCKLGVVTNKTRLLADPILENLELMQYLDIVIGPEDITDIKPAPEGLLKAMQELQQLPMNTAYIGDHLKDIQTANAAHIDAIAVGYGFRSPNDPIASWPARYFADTPAALIKTIYETRKEDQL